MSDENEGCGGSYVINPETGARDLVERTAEAPPPEASPVEEKSPPEAPVVQVKPAKAGFFSTVTPDAPADTTITE
jgi:hypothetical protein